MRGVLRWLDERLELGDSVLAVLRHPVPAELERPVGWWYVTGSATLALFIVQVVTGVGLAMTYVPAPNSAYDSLQFISKDATLGHAVRGMHFWGASFMVVLVLVHMTQVFLFGGHKFPRELNWISGSLLLLATLALAFTGQLLRWDQDAFWAVVVAAEQAAHAPVFGDWLARLVMAGQNVGGATLTRFYATHVFLIPAAAFGLIALHLYLVVKRGISEPPVAGEPVDPATYSDRYRGLLARGIPFYPDAMYRDVLASFVLVVLVAVLGFTVGAPELGRPADPTLIVADPRPDWYLLGYFALLALIPPVTEGLVIIGLPVLAFAFLFALPLVRPYGERHWSRRPSAIAVVAIPALIYVALTFAGVQSAWAPVLDERAELPASVTEGLDAQARRGADLYLAKGCWSCHAIAGSGGRRGPDMSDVAARLPRDRIIARILAGGGGMPAYSGSISPDELADLVRFLETRR